MNLKRNLNQFERRKKSTVSLYDNTLSNNAS